LLAVEIRRILARRLIRLLLLLYVLGIAVAAVILLVKSAGEPTPYSDPRFHLETLIHVFGGTTVPLVLGAWLIGASSIGAEWHAGTISTTLTWEPRRVRLLLAKAAAAVIVSALVYLGLQALMAALFLPAAFAGGQTGGIDRAWVAEAAALLGRAVALTGIAAVIGFSLASFTRNTAAALGVGFAYVVILENFLAALRPGWRSWMLVQNAVIFVANFHDQVGGSPRDVLSSGLIISGYAVAMLAIATAWFRARDVT